ncbi:MAG: type II secretion system F family protein [Planctomycetia bacterium]
MATFRYSAISSDGRTVRGSVEANSQPEALEELRRRNLMPLKVDDRGGADPEPAAADDRGRREEKKPAAPKAAGGGGLFAAKPGVRKHEEVVIFTRQLATMIGAGIPMLESLEILQEQAESKEFSLLLNRVIDEVRSGQDLSTAIGRYPKVFTDVYVSMIKAGEASGQIDDILVRLADYMEAAQRLKRDIKSAMTYPVVSLVMITGITAFLMLAIVPKFKEVFASLDVELPGLTKGVLGASDFTRENWVLILVAMVLAGFGLHVYKRTDRGGWQWDWLMLKVPVFGPLFRKVGLSRFSKTFSTMLKSGVPILGALDIVADTAGNRVIRDAVINARESVRQGESLAKPLADSTVFPPMVTRMIGIGEKTGSLEQLLEKISEFYDEQVRATVKQLTSLIEPIMISVMGLMVGTIVLSVFLPIFELQKQLAAR